MKPRGKSLGGVDWLHINCASWLGPNKWYDAGVNASTRKHHL